MNWTNRTSFSGGTTQWKSAGSSSPAPPRTSRYPPPNKVVLYQGSWNWYSYVLRIAVWLHSGLYEYNQPTVSLRGVLYEQEDLLVLVRVPSRVVYEYDRRPYVPYPLGRWCCLASLQREPQPTAHSHLKTTERNDGYYCNNK